MKTYFVIVREPRVRSFSVTKAVVSAESPEAALALVKSYYPPACSGWSENAVFMVEREVLPNTVLLVG